jgi:hypothetical protein
MLGTSLEDLVSDVAACLVAIDSSRIQHKGFQPGIGPFGEAQLVRLPAEELRRLDARSYELAQVKRSPDLLLPTDWQLEFKIPRPCGDNGRLAEQWSENLLHPYPGNTSLLGDCIKLLSSGGNEKKAVLVIGYEHSQPQVDLSDCLQDSRFSRIIC